MSEQRRRYSSVEEMVRDISDDPAFAESVCEKMKAREVIGTLMALRTLANLSVSGLAERMGQAESTVNIIESLIDDDASLGCLKRYAAALGLEMKITFVKKPADVREE